MRNSFVFVILFCCSNVFGQEDKDVYLKRNSVDLENEFSLMINKQKIIGLGALHGSSETEQVEIKLLTDLAKNHQLAYYFPETDFATGIFFQRYIETGDEVLLKNLIQLYGIRVPQEASIAMFNKWKQIRPLFIQYQIKIIGIDQIVNYENTLKLLLENLSSSAKWPYIDSLQGELRNENRNFTSYYNSPSKSLIKRMALNYRINQKQLKTSITDTILFNHLIQNIEATFDGTYRENQNFKNYQFCYTHLNLQEKTQFFRMGVYHLMKNEINGNKPLFAKLIGSQIYSENQVLTIYGFLTKSKVLWETKYNSENEYKNYKTKAGFGISDAFYEHAKGIKYLKRNRLSNQTLFYLNKENSPYSIPNTIDLIHTKNWFNKFNWKFKNELSTCNYIDIAILIRKSKASLPIEEIK